MTATEFPLNSAEYNRFVLELSQLGYDIEGILGRGGMGTVFRARQQHLDRTVAVKAISHSLIADQAARKRVESEMRTMASLKHPAIVRVEYGQITASGIPFFVMEFIEGPTLEETIAGKRFGVDQVADILAPVAEALDFLHQRRIVHRDVKPANIMLSPDGAVLTDFGISYIADDTRLTQEGSIVGTDSYMAPELFAVGALSSGVAPQASPLSDNYALALVALEMLTGSRLRSTMSREGWRGPRNLSQIRSAPQPRVFARALANDPRERYASASEFISDLRGKRALLNDARRMPSASPRRRGRPALATAMCVALLAIVGLGGAGAWYSTARWSGSERVLADMYPQLLPAYSGGKGWRGATCRSEEPDPDQSAKIVCRTDDLIYVVADFGSSQTRARYTPAESWGDFDADGCRMQSAALIGTDGGDAADATYVVVPSAPRDFSAILLSGADADDARTKTPICD